MKNGWSNWYVCFFIIKKTPNIYTKQNLSPGDHFGTKYDEVEAKFGEVDVLLFDLHFQQARRI